MNKPKILVGVPTIGTNDYRFTLSLASLIIPDSSSILAIPRVMIDTSRNMCCEKLLEGDATHLLFIDDDMTFDPYLLSNMLEHDVDIIGALAFKRREKYEPCVYNKKEDGLYYPILPQIFQEVDVVGTGGMLIKREVIEKLKNPWFETYYDKQGTHWSVDFSFCIKAKKAGFKIWVDPKIEMKHIGDAPLIGKSDFLKYISGINGKK